MRYIFLKGKEMLFKIDHHIDFLSKYYFFKKNSQIVLTGRSWSQCDVGSKKFINNKCFILSIMHIMEYKKIKMKIGNRI